MTRKSTIICTFDYIQEIIIKENKYECLRKRGTFRTKTMICCLCFFAIFNAVSSYSFEDVGRLQDYLKLKEHNPTVRPIRNQSLPIQIEVSLTLLTIVDFDMTNGRLETTGFVTSTWRDHLLNWNNTEFKDIRSIPVKDGEIWTPGIAQLDAFSDEGELLSITLLSDGSVVHALAKTYSTFCDLDMTYYPVDEHICSFELLSVYHPLNEMSLVPVSSDVSFKLVKPHGEWKVIDAYSRQKSRPNQGLETAGIEIVYVFKRQPSFTVLHKSVPLLILGTADMFIHIVPLNSGERVSYAVTVLLAFVFWQAVVTEELPKNSSNISIFSALITASIIVSGLSTVLSVVLCRIADFDEDRQIPEALQKWARMCRWRKKLIKTKVLKSRMERSKANDESNGTIANGDAAKQEIQKTASENTQSVEEEMLEVKVTWVEAANSFDSIFFMCHVGFSVLSAIGFALIFLL